MYEFTIYSIQHHRIITVMVGASSIDDAKYIVTTSYLDCEIINVIEK